MKLLRKLFLPLLSEVWRTEHHHAIDFTAFDQLLCDQTGFDRFADSDAIGNQHANWIQTHCHQEWNQLIRPGLDCDFAKASEGACCCTR